MVGKPSRFLLQLGDETWYQTLYLSKNLKIISLEGNTMKRAIFISVAIIGVSINSVSADMWREVLPGTPGNPNANEAMRFDSRYDRGGFAGHVDERDEFVLESWSYPGSIHTIQSNESVNDTEKSSPVEAKDSEENIIEISKNETTSIVATVSENSTVEDDNVVHSNDVN